MINPKKEKNLTIKIGELIKKKGRKLDFLKAEFQIYILQIHFKQKQKKINLKIKKCDEIRSQEIKNK